MTRQTFPAYHAPGLKASVRTLPETGYVRESQLIPALLPFSPTTLARMVKRGSFPAPIKLSPRVTVWRVEDVRTWLADPTGYGAARAAEAR